MKYVLAVAMILSVGAASAQQTQKPTAQVQSPPASLNCGSDQVVWVNTSTKVYHTKGDRYFGNTKQGKFTCEKTATSEGDRPVKR
jgi:hypothetical protein